MKFSYTVTPIPQTPEQIANRPRLPWQKKNKRLAGATEEERSFPPPKKSFRRRLFRCGARGPIPLPSAPPSDASSILSEEGARKPPPFSASDASSTLSEEPPEPPKEAEEEEEASLGPPRNDSGTTAVATPGAETPTTPEGEERIAEQIAWRISKSAAARRQKSASPPSTSHQIRRKPLPPSAFLSRRRPSLPSATFPPSSSPPPDPKILSWAANVQRQTKGANIAADAYLSCVPHDTLSVASKAVKKEDEDGDGSVKVGEEAVMDFEMPVMHVWGMLALFILLFGVCWAWKRFVAARVGTTVVGTGGSVKGNVEFLLPLRR